MSFRFGERLRGSRYSARPLKKPLAWLARDISNKWCLFLFALPPHATGKLRSAFDRPSGAGGEDEWNLFCAILERALRCRCRRQQCSELLSPPVPKKQSKAWTTDCTQFPLLRRLIRSILINIIRIGSGGFLHFLSLLRPIHLNNIQFQRREVEHGESNDESIWMR